MCDASKADSIGHRCLDLRLTRRTGRCGWLYSIILRRSVHGRRARFQAIDGGVADLERTESALQSSSACRNALNRAIAAATDRQCSPADDQCNPFRKTVGELLVVCDELIFVVHVGDTQENHSRTFLADRSGDGFKWRLHPRFTACHPDSRNTTSINWPGNA